MSGGSYGYVSNEMENGHVDKAADYLDLAIAQLRRIAAADVQVMETEERNGYRIGTMRAGTDTERVLTEMALGALEQRLQRFAKAVADVADQARDLAPLFHELEWQQSGDTGIDRVQQFAREWANRQLAK